MAITSQWTGPFRMFTSASLYAYCRIRQCACPRPRAAFKTSACHGPPRCLFCAPTHTCLARSDCHTSGGNLLKECLAAHPVDVLMWPRGIKTPQFSTVPTGNVFWLSSQESLPTTQTSSLKAQIWSPRQCVRCILYYFPFFPSLDSNSIELNACCNFYRMHP